METKAMLCNLYWYKAAKEIYCGFNWKKNKNHHPSSLPIKDVWSGENRCPYQSQDSLFTSKKILSASSTWAEQVTWPPTVLNFPFFSHSFMGSFWVAKDAQSIEMKRGWVGSVCGAYYGRLGHLYYEQIKQLAPISVYIITYRLYTFNFM